MKFTDSHCHLDFSEFSDHLAHLLTSCFQAGIHRIIVPAVAPDNWLKVLTLNEQSKILPACSPQLFPCLGIHPWFLKGLNIDSLEQLSNLTRQHQSDIVAIGETGIDNIVAKAQDNLSQQLAFFDHQLQLANQYHLPVILHHRQSHQQIIPRLKQIKSPYGGIIHAFSGSYQQAKAYIDLGFKIGVGGTITYDRAIKTIKAIQGVPLSSIVLETDAPSMPLSGFQGQMNTPLRIIDVFEKLCSIRAEQAETIAEQIEDNINQLFHLN